MARNTTKASRAGSTRQPVGLGFLPVEARHGFLIEVPKGTGKNDFIRISEHRNVDLSQLDSLGQIANLVNELDSVGAPSESKRSPNGDPGLRVLIDRSRWLALAPEFWEEANRRLRANGLPSCKFQKNPAKPIPIHPSLGKELCVLCWAVEEAQPDLIPNALLNWQNLAPEERWWLYTMTVATTGQAIHHRGLGWRKALRAAIADNPFIKGEGSSPRSRRELLGHSQLTLDLDL
jgi:hypothetical protein